MKRVDEMSIEEMEGYFGKVDRVVRIFGRSYRLFWPFKIFSPFSPARFLLNIGVLATWVIAINALITRPSIEEFAIPLAQTWSVILILVFLIGVVERHVRIRIRYRRLMRQHRFGQVARVFSPGGQSNTIPEARKVDMRKPPPKKDAPGTPSTPTDSTKEPVRTLTPEIVNTDEDRDLVEIGMDILRKMFKQ